MKQQKSNNKWLQFVNIPFQMGIVIFIGVFIGVKLDAYFEKGNLFTIILSLLSVFVALYTVIRNVNNLNKND